MTSPKPKSGLIHAAEMLVQKRRSAPKKPAPQMSLDLWPDAVRGVPNAVLRGALFGISKRRAFVQNELIISVEGHRIHFTGQRFNQTDLDTFEMLVHLARLQPLGTSVDFTAHALLKTMGRGTGKTQHQQLHDEIVRLRSGNVEISGDNHGKVYGEGLVKKYYMDKDIGRYIVELSPELLALYEAGYTQVDFGQRQALSTNLSKWLHGFFSSHAKPYPYKVATLKDLCGSTSSDLRDFRRMLKAALADLVDIGMLVEWTIDTNDLVTVKKVPTFSQRQHLERAAKKQQRSR
jgi:hypothetical protein